MIFPRKISGFGMIFLCGFHLFLSLSGFVFPIGHFSSSVSLPLDAVSGSTLAVSTRKVRAAYSGSCLRVRRSSDDTEQDIGFVGNDLDTSSLTSFVGANDGFVVRWYDQSGTTRFLSQTTKANQPKVVSSGSVVTGVDGKPALDFDGSNDGFQLLNADLTGASISNIMTASAYTTFSVFVLDTISTSTGSTFSTPYLWGDSSRYIGLHFQATTKMRFYNWDGNEDYAEVTIATSTEYLAETRHDTGNLYAKVNNGTEASAASGNTQVVAGTPAVMSNNGTCADGRVSEIIFYNSALSSGNRTLVAEAVNSTYTIY